MPIKIFGTKNTPYARLSNNFKQDMFIRGLKYPTVSNYIYSNMLTTPTWKTIIRRTSTRSTCTGNDDCLIYHNSKAECLASNCKYEVSTIGDQFSELYEKESNNRKKEALEIAVDKKLDQNPELKEALLSTGNHPLVYVSRGKWMGKQSPDDGENNYGKILEAARYRLVGEKDQNIKAKNEEIKEENMYNIYLAYSNLEKLIREGENIDDYNGLTALKVLSKMKDNGIDISKVFNMDFIINEARRNNYSGPSDSNIVNSDMFLALKKPKIIAALVRGKYLSNDRERKLNRIPRIVLDMYFDYLLNKADQFQNIDPKDYAKAKRQQLFMLSAVDRRKTGNDLYDLYKKGMLSESLSKEIDNAIKSLDIPTEEEVKDSKDMVAAIYGSINTDDEVIILPLSSKPSGKAVLIYENDPPHPDPTYNLKGLSPLDDSVMIRIGGKIYPSITYYCIAVELASCLGTHKSISGIDNTIPTKAYDMLKVQDSDSFLDLRIVERNLDKLRRESYRDKLMVNTREALRVKFSNRRAQNVLLSTKNDKLIWDDKNDPILGSKKPEAYNFVGKELMKLRDTIREDRKASGYMEDVEDILSLKVLYNVFQNDFLKGWFNMRVRDMCNVILTMKDYIYLKYNKIQNLTPDFATADEITSPPPNPFVQMVGRYKGFMSFISSRDQEKVLRIMWKRLAVMIYYLMKHVTSSTTNSIAIVLKKIESLASLPKNCIKVLPNEKENCILSALINIIGGINTLNKKYGANSVLKEVDFNAAVTILLNVNSLAEQRALQRNMASNDKPIPPSVPVRSKITDNDIIELRTKLSGPPNYYKEEVYEKVIEEVEKIGKIPDDNQLDILAKSYQAILSNKKPAVKLQRRPRESKKKYLERVKKAQGLSPKSYLSREEDEEDLVFDTDEEEEDLVFDTDEEEEEDLVVDTDEEEDEEEEEEEEEQEEEPSFIPDPVISDNILQALLSTGVAVDDDSFVFMVDDAIAFVSSYNEISSKMKTNRINFFASPQWGMTIG
jgi:predicted NAD-dependent protein-ADP-ribosyltransferase YbiA (DUF1768 family)